MTDEDRRNAEEAARRRCDRTIRGMVKWGALGVGRGSAFAFTDCRDR